MTFYLPTARKNAALDTITASAGATATIKIYSGAVPADANAANSGSLLVSLPCSNPIAPAAASGTLTFSAITTTNASAGGTASYYRLFASDGTTTLAQGAVGTSGAELNLVSTTIANAQPVQITSLTISI